MNGADYPMNYCLKQLNVIIFKTVMAPKRAVYLIFQNFY